MRYSVTFLEKRFRILKSLGSRSTLATNSKPSSRHVKSHASLSTPTTSNACPLCSDLHFIRSCQTFLPSNVFDRRNILKQHRICFNCLVPDHLSPEHKNRMYCQVCNKIHHTLLDDPIASPRSSTSPTTTRTSIISQLPACQFKPQQQYVRRFTKHRTIVFNYVVVLSCASIVSNSICYRCVYLWCTHFTS